MQIKYNNIMSCFFNMIVNQQESIEWLKFALDNNNPMPTIKDWAAVLSFAEKQALIGICLPNECPPNLPKELLLQWIG